MELLDDLKMSLLNISFVTIYIIHKMLVLLKNNLNYLKDSIFECFLKEYNRLLLFFSKEIIFSRHIIMESLSPEGKNINKDIRNIFRLKALNYTAIKDIRNLFRLEKETKRLKDRILRDIENLFKHEKEKKYDRPVRVSNFWSNDYIEYKSNGDRNKTLSVEEYQNKIRPYLKDIIKSDTWKIQLTGAINFISSINNNEDRVMNSKSDNIEIMINDEKDEVIKKLCDSLKNRYQNNLESLKGCEFVFNYVHLLHYKCHKINLNYGGSYIDSPD